MKTLNIRSSLKYILFAALLNMFNLNAFSQDFDKDMKFFYEGFISQPSLECHMTSKAYKSDQTVFFNQEVKLIIHNNQYYYEMGNKLYISNKKYLLWIDKDDKRIIVGATDVNEITKFKNKLAQQMDTTMFRSLGNIVFEGNSNGVKSYKIVNLTNAYIRQANISFDVATNYLKKMEFIFNENENMGVASSSTEFTKININPQINESVFDQSAYIQVNKGVISLTPAYRNYQLVTIDNSVLNKLK